MSGIILLHAQVCILQLCKVSSVSVHLFRRSCAYKKYGQKDGQGDSYIPPAPSQKKEQLCLPGV